MLHYPSAKNHTFTLSHKKESRTFHSTLFFSRIYILVDTYMRVLERGREFLSPFGRTICFAVRFERSGPPKIFDFWGERRHWALPTRQASSVRFNCRTRAQVVEKIVRSVSWDKKQVVDVVDLNNPCWFVLQCHLVFSSPGRGSAAKVLKIFELCK